jgi:AraC-like DNA-binding protein
MLYTYQENEVGAHFSLSTDHLVDLPQLSRFDNLIHIHWNRTELPLSVDVDGVPIHLQPGQITTTTFAQKLKILSKSIPLTSFSFNREFYCINDHDHEVSCNGLIFFGTNEQPIVQLENEEIQKFSLLYDVFLDEYRTRDSTQGEMLRVLLKRLIIKVTRLVKSQLIVEALPDHQVDTIRKFNLLVEQHFREKKQVSDYAELLFKSPKTLSNLFAKFNNKTPLQIIHERIILEAKRQLLYTDRSGKEIAYELGFEDASTFQKLFKRITEKTPQQFKADLQALNRR